VLEAAERRRRDNELCRNVLREGASHEVLGIESSDEEDVDSASSGGPRRQPSAVEIVVLDGDDDAAHAPPTASVSGACAPVVVDLLHADDQQGDRSAEIIDLT